MSTVKRKSYTGAFKAKVGLEAIRGERTVNEIGQAYGVHQAQVRQWKQEIVGGVRRVCSARPAGRSLSTPGRATSACTPRSGG